MSLLVRNIINKAIKKDRQPHALCFFYDGKFDRRLWQYDNIKFFGNIGGSKYPWKTELKHKNLNFIPADFPTIAHGVELDFVICNDRLGPQYNVAKTYADMCHLPLVCIEHSLPPRSDTMFLQQMANRNETTLYTNEYVMKRWGIDNHPKHIFVPYYGYGAAPPKVRKDGDKSIDVLVYGNFSNEDLATIYNILKPIKNKVVLQHSQTNIEDIDNYFAKSKIYLNLAKNNEVPYSVHLAMWCRTAVISTSNELTNELIKPETGRVTSIISKLQTEILNLLDNDEQRQYLVNNAYNTVDNDILEYADFDFESIFRKIQNEVYIR